MSKYYLITIALLTAYIGLSMPYTVESVRNHISERVYHWRETQAIIKKNDSRDINLATFQAVRMPELPEVR